MYNIVNLLDFGAFVRLESGVDGLLHVSQISKEHVAKPSDALTVGQSVEVKVIDINNDDRKISLSIKEVNEENEPQEENKEENKEEAIEDTMVNDNSEPTIGDIINSK